MQTKVLFFSIIVALTSTKVYSQSNLLQESDIPRGYNRKYVANSEKRWERKRVDAFVVDTNGNVYKGQLMTFNNERLYFYASDSLFYNNPDEDLIFTFNPNEIQRIRLERPNQLAKGAFIGAIAALGPSIYATIEFVSQGEAGWLVLILPAVYLGSAMIFVPTGLTIGYLHGVSLDYKTQGDIDSFKILAEELKKYTLFPDEVPKNVLVQEHNKSIIQEVHQLPKYKDRKRDLLSYSKFNIGLSVGGIISPGMNDIKNSLENQLPSDFYSGSDLYYPNIDFDLAYRITPNIRLGLGISGWLYGVEYYRNMPEDAYSSLFFDYSNTSFSINSEYIFQPVRRLMSRRGEFSLGVGLSASTFSGYLLNDSYSNNGGFNTEEIALDPEFNSHLDFSLAYDFYIFRFLSLRLSVNGQQAFNGITTKAYKFQDLLGDEYNIQPININTSSISAEFGLRLHF